MEAESNNESKGGPDDQAFLNYLRVSHDGNIANDHLDDGEAHGQSLTPQPNHKNVTGTSSENSDKVQQQVPTKSDSSSSAKAEAREAPNSNGSQQTTATSSVPFNKHFLDLWQASNDGSNDNTIRAGNQHGRKTFQNNLQGLFQPPPTTAGTEEQAGTETTAEHEEDDERAEKKTPTLPHKMAQAVDQNFLNLLRASHDETIRAGNRQEDKQHAQSPLMGLFDPPPQPTKTLPSARHKSPPRPPRPPNVHARSQSVAMEKPNIIQNRSHSVTFNRGTEFRDVGDGSSDEQADDASLAARISAYAKDHKRRTSFTLGNLGSRQGHNRKLTIDDVIGGGKFETEAEASILKALEEHQLQKLASHRRLQSETSTILSGVPENITHDFSADEDNAQGGKDIPGRGHLHDDEGSTVSRSSAIRQQSRPLLSAERGRKPKAALHRHTMSIEQRLEGLSLAMWKMEDDDDDDDDDDDHQGNAYFDGLPESTGQGLSSTARVDRKDMPPSPRTRLDTAHSEYALPVVAENEESIADAGNDDSHTTDMEDQDPNSPVSTGTVAAQSTATRKKQRFGSTVDALRDKWEIWLAFFRPRKQYMVAYIRRIVFYIILPFVGTAAILFYFFNNPPAADAENGVTAIGASVSWWLLYVARQCVTLSTALALQFFVIDFLGVGTRIMLRLLGPTITLLIVQSKGWPFVVLTWSILDFGLLFGKNEFAAHWGYFQDAVGLFNSENPSGTVVDNDWNRRALLIGVTVSLFVTVKRFLVALLLGRQTFYHYGEQLAVVLNKMLLVGEVARLAKRIYKSHASMSLGRTQAAENLDQDLQTVRGLSLPFDDDDAESDSATSTMKSFGTEKLIDTSKRSPLTGSLLPSEKAKLMRLVEQWEEPTRRATQLNQRISISSILKFRNALTLINDYYPFSYAFGVADSRESCIDGAQELFSRLLLADERDSRNVHFETIALIALEGDVVNQEKAKELMRVFRPDRDGCLTILDFVRSIDAVYKEFRLLQASIENSSEIDRAFENIVNVVFYAVVVTIILSLLGFDPFALFLSLSSVILAFAFMIGSASSNYFEGVLFILGRRPYGIGDFIHVSNVESNITSSAGWRVQHVSLFETSFTWVSTNETATVSNGSLASSRIINWARSPHPRFIINFIVPIETKYETLELFKRAVEEYIKVRPREWLAFNTFRVNGVYADKGYMQVDVIVQHRDSWQNIALVMESRGNLSSFCLEVQKILGMQYRTPIVPLEISSRNIDDGLITVNQKQDEQGSLDGSTSSEAESKTDLFRSIAQSRHSIRMIR